MSGVALALVEPVYEVNVGHVARVCANFGVHDFFLVNPKADLRLARKFASHGVTLLDKAKICSFSDLTRRFNYLVGTTAISSKRSSNLLRSTIAPDALEKHIGSFDGSICLVFGRDTTGLKNAELEACDIVVSIHTGTAYTTLNISHSVAIILYELSTLNKHEGSKIASKHNRERVVKNAIEIANMSRFPQHRVDLLRNTVKRMINKSNPTEREITLLMGLTRKALLALQMGEHSP
jgi:tRNA/rRNA methyltransferase